MPRRTASVIAFGLALACAATAATPRADPLPDGADPAIVGDDAGTAQIDLLRRAERLEHDLRLDDALVLYRQALARDPGSRLARRARARIEWIEARNPDDARPLVELMRMRQLAPGELTPSRLESFERDVDGTAPGPVRRESRALIAGAWLERLDQPARAVPAYERWLAEPGIDRSEWEIATTGLASARAALGDLRGSIESLEAAGLGQRVQTSYLQLERVGRWARPLSMALIASFVLLALGLGRRGFFPRALARALSLPRLALGAYALGIPLGIAHIHRPETLRAMLLLVPAAAALVALASVCGAGLPDEAPRRRRALALVGVAAQIGIGYLAMDQSRVLLAMLMAFKAR